MNLENHGEMFWEPSACMDIPSSDGRLSVWTNPQHADGLNQSYSCLVAARNNRASLLCYFKLCVLFHSHLSIQTEVRVQKCQIWVKIGDFLSRMTLKFDRWHWKGIGHLFYPTSSFVHHFVTICEFKLELRSGNAQFRSNHWFFVLYDDRNIVNKTFRERQHPSAPRSVKE